MAKSIEPPRTPTGALARHVKDRFGMMVSEDQMKRFEREIDRICGVRGIDDRADLLRRIRAEPKSELELEVAEAASINHTHFFREREVLQQLDERVLARVRPGQPVHLWSAAASSGEEAYSIAMMVRERFPIGAAARILGTDISARVIERAREGRYTTRRMSHVPQAMRKRYFDVRGDVLHVKDTLQQLCLFRRFNLLSERWPFRSKFHAILLRNVLYYFSDKDQARLLERMHHHTHLGGYLFLSVTESIGHLGTPWQAVASGVYARGTR
ncbi:MAG: protein-glutamate O-methyltransferase CheR [Myxococcota bacterium]